MLATATTGGTHKPPGPKVQEIHLVKASKGKQEKFGTWSEIRGEGVLTGSFSQIWLREGFNNKNRDIKDLVPNAGTNSVPNPKYPHFSFEAFPYFVIRSCGCKCCKQILLRQLLMLDQATYVCHSWWCSQA